MFAAAILALLITVSLALARAGDRSEYQPMALATLAMVVYALGRTAEAGALLEEALPLARQAGGLALGQVLRSLSSYEWETGALDAAGAHAEELQADSSRRSIWTQALGQAKQRMTAQQPGLVTIAAHHRDETVKSKLAAARRAKAKASEEAKQARLF